MMPPIEFKALSEATDRPVVSSDLTRNLTRYGLIDPNKKLAGANNKSD